jgi:hypothetical protein
LTTQHSDLTFRPITGPGELGLFTRLPYELNGELASDLSDGHRQPGWLWMALRGDHLLARAAWWARQGAGAPGALDILDIDDSAGPEAVDAATALLTAAMAEVVPAGERPPEYIRFLPPGRRGSPDGGRAHRRAPVRGAAAAGVAARHEDPGTHRAPRVPPGQRA